ncbi:MAG: hypothetical protein Q8Q26_06960 [Pseudorhodobacter sp.]|nr:hypothetical protein [Pseudorhodobacter sp.]
MQKSDRLSRDCDTIARYGQNFLKNMAKLGRRAMRGAQNGHAGGSLASHLQQDYLMSRRQERLPDEPFEKEHDHGRF